MFHLAPSPTPQPLDCTPPRAPEGRRQLAVSVPTAQDLAEDVLKHPLTAVLSGQYDALNRSFAGQVQLTTDESHAVLVVFEGMASYENVSIELDCDHDTVVVTGENVSGEHSAQARRTVT
jgi:hypothetical protein